MMIQPRPVTRISAIALICFVSSCAAKEKSSQSAPATESVMTADGEAADKKPAEERQIDTAVTGVEELVQTNNAFAFDVYRASRSDQFVVSPHGLAETLALLHAGTAGNSASQIAKTLRVNLDERDLHERFRLLHDVLRSRTTSTNRESKRGFRLLVSPGIWVSDKIEPTTKFLQVATNQHLATIERFDFGTKGAVAQKAINAHYSDATGGKVDAVVTEIAKDTKLLFTSTVQFDAPWALPFERGLTEDANFATPDGPRAVPMMHGRIRVGYLDGEGFQLAELPYADGLVSAWVVLPDEGNEKFDATLTADYFEWMVASARQRDVDVRLPRFELTTRHSFAAVLSTMGMPDVFDPEKADLSRFAATDAPTAVNDVIQVARLSVDEDGSDAVATTRGPVTSSGNKLPHFEASRPFVFVVRDNPTGAILAVARISSP